MSSRRPSFPEFDLLGMNRIAAPIGRAMDLIQRCFSLMTGLKKLLVAGGQLLALFGYPNRCLAVAITT